MTRLLPDKLDDEPSAGCSGPTENLQHNETGQVGRPRPEFWNLGDVAAIVDLQQMAEDLDVDLIGNTKHRTVYKAEQAACSFSAPIGRGESVRRAERWKVVAPRNILRFCPRNPPLRGD